MRRQVRAEQAEPAVLHTSACRKRAHCQRQREHAAVVVELPTTESLHEQAIMRAAAAQWRAAAFLLERKFPEGWSPTRRASEPTVPDVDDSFARSTESPSRVDVVCCMSLRPKLALEARALRSSATVFVTGAAQDDDVPVRWRLLRCWRLLRRCTRGVCVEDAIRIARSLLPWRSWGFSYSRQGAHLDCVQPHHNHNPCLTIRTCCAPVGFGT